MSRPLKARDIATHIQIRWPGGIPDIEIALDASHAGWRLDRALAAARADPVARAAEGADPKRRADARRQARSATRRPRSSGDERFTLAVPEPEPAHNEPQDIPLTIVFEDEHLLVVDKPAGLVVHPAAGNRDGTLVNALLHHCGGSLSGIGGVARPGIVHRIDKDTSGLLVVAKTDVAHEGLAKQFADHRIDRRYLAIVVGRAAGRPRARSTRRSPARRTNRKKIAIVERRPRQARGDALEAARSRCSDAALVECRLETGRTHQVRVHMASIGHPLLGDPVYGRREKRIAESC